jgi:hypothetical protein
MQQISIPTPIHIPEVQRKQTLGAAIELCVDAAGLEPKSIQMDLRLDKAQFSRWLSGAEGVTWPKLSALMDHCGNEAPLMWMAHSRGFDLHSMRKVESEVERQNRLLREENHALRRVLQGATA